MARKRMIDPKIWESEQVMSLSPFEFKIYIFLISSADDEGRLKISYPIFKARIYPVDCFSEENPKKREKNSENGESVINSIRKSLQHMKDIELIDLYTDGKHEYVQHPNWKIYQKIDKPRASVLPSKIACESSNGSRIVGEESLNNQGGVAPNRIELNGIEVNGIEFNKKEVNKKRKDAAPPTASPSEVNSPPLKTTTATATPKTKPKNQQLIEAAELLRVEDPEGYKEFIALHPEIVSKEIKWEVT